MASKSIGGIFATLSLRDTQFRKGLQGAGKQLSAFGKQSAAIGNNVAMAATGLAAAGVAGFVGFAISASKAASNIETLTMQFETLLGGADAAGKRMKEITKFAASTPFAIAEIAATSKQLQNAGGDILAIGDGLKMVGDAAAISGRPLEEVALHIGRVFGAMTSGTSAGESVGRLVEIGLITGDVKREFEALAVAQKKGATATLTGEQALAKMQSVLSKTEGAMARLATTTEGKLSNLGDNISQLKVAFGTGLNDGLKVALDATNNFLPQLESKFAEVGQMIGGAISNAVQGDTAQLAATGGYIGEVISAGFKVALLKGIDELGTQFVNAGNALVAELRTAFQLASGITPDGKVGQQKKAFPMELYMKNAIDSIQNSQNLQLLKAENATAQSLKYAQEQIAKNKVSSAAIPVVAPKIEIPDVANLEISIPGAPERQIDDYQRRGLAMSKSPGAVQDKVLKAIEQMRDILKAAKIQGKELTW